MNKLFFIHIIIISICSAMPPKAPRISEGAARVSLGEKSTCKRGAEDEELLKQAQARVKEAQKEQGALLKKATTDQSPITIAKGLTFDDLVYMAGRYLSTVKTKSCKDLNLKNHQRTAHSIRKITYSSWDETCRVAFDVISGSGSGQINLACVSLVTSTLLKLKPQDYQSWVIHDLVTIQEIINAVQINMDLLKKVDRARTDLPLYILIIAHGRDQILIEPKGIELYNCFNAQTNEELVRAYKKSLRITNILAAEIDDGIFKGGIGEFPPITDENKKNIVWDLFRTAAREGYINAQYNLTNMVHTGNYSGVVNGTPITDENRDRIAGDLLRAVARDGVTDAQYNLAVLIGNERYSNDADGHTIITKEHRTKAAGDLYRAAALGGHIKALYNLAGLIRNNHYSKNLNGTQITDKNRNDAIADILSAAARGGLAPAQHNLAALIIQGVCSKDINGTHITTEQDRNKAIGDLFGLAARNGMALAKCNLAVLICRNQYHQRIDGTPIGIEKNAYIESILRDILDVETFRNILEIGTITNLEPHEIVKKCITIFKNIIPTDREEEIFNYLSERINILPNLKHREYYHLLLLHLFNKEISDELLSGCMTSDHPDALVLYLAIRFPENNIAEQTENLELAEGSPDASAAASTKPSSAANPTPSSTDEEESFSDDDVEEDVIASELANSKAIGSQNITVSQEDDDVTCYNISEPKKLEKKAEINRILLEKRRDLKTVSPISEKSKKQQVSIVWTDTAREQLREVRGDKTFTRRLGLLIETLKETLCGGVNTIKVLRVRIDNNPIFSGRLTQQHRLVVTRAYRPDGSVEKIIIHRIIGHYDEK
ncbi:MAG: hypothetical protein HEEMFOPI_00080 [Holosporales bacterium]